MIRNALLALLISVWATPALAAAVEYYATVDRDRVPLDQTLTLQVTLAFDQGDETGEVQLPEAPDFDVLRQGRSDHSSFSFGGGAASFRKVRTWTLVLQPRREGKLPILPGKVEIGGKRYETGKLTVEVGPATGQPHAQPPPRGGGRPPGFPPMSGFDDDPFGSMLGGGPQPSESDLFLRASVDREEVWVGEQVTLSVWLMSRVDVSHVEGLKMPRLDGFWAEELETPRQISATTRMIDGVPYRAYLIQRKALFPLRAGEISIDPVEIDVVSGRSIFGGGRKQHRVSPGATLQVKALPAGAPAAFRRGNVGHWSLSAQATPAEVSLGSPVTVRITATGTGNLQNLELPTLPKLEGFKLFEPSRTEEVQVQQRRYGGSKTLEYVLVPERAGSFTVPALEFASFDPAQGAYQQVRTPAIPITVLQGQGAAVATGPGAAPPAAELGADAGLEPLRSTAVVLAAETPLYERPWFLAALLAPALAVAGVAASPWLRRRQAAPQRRRRRGRSAAGLPAEVAGLAERGDPAFFAACERLLHERASARIDRPAHGLRREELCAALAAAGVAADAIEACTEALATCEMGRYAPGALGADAIAATREAASRALEGLEEAP